MPKFGNSYKRYEPFFPQRSYYHIKYFYKIQKMEEEQRTKVITSEDAKLLFFRPSSQVNVKTEAALDFEKLIANL